MIVTLADHPERTAQVEAFIRETWPTSIWSASGPGPSLAEMLERFAEDTLLLLEDGELVAVGNSRRLTAPDVLPDTGWDWAVQAEGTGPDRCALMVTVHRDHQRRGHSQRLLRAYVERTEGRLIIPVRPPSKQPDQPIEAVLADPMADPWLRTHLKLGARILGPCHHSMTLKAPWADWERWGPAGLIAPVVRDGDQGVYVEPNVWVEHPT